MNGVPKLWFLCQSFTTQCRSSDHHLCSSSQKSGYCWCMIILNHTVGVISQRSHLKWLPFQDRWTLLNTLNRVVGKYINIGMKTANDPLSGPSVTFQRPSLSHPLECTMILPLVFIVVLPPSWFRIILTYLCKRFNENPRSPHSTRDSCDFIENIAWLCLEVIDG